jgi:hypothetical protein
MSAATRVLNKRCGPMPPGSIYSGRPTKWGNPFVIGRDGLRAEVIAKHRVWICDQPELIAALPSCAAAAWFASVPPPLAMATCCWR